MATVYLPDNDHVVRHVPANLVERDEETGVVIGVFPQAFALRDGEDYLSASWLEHFPGSRDERVRLTVAAFAAVRNVRPRQGIAIGCVEDVRQACAGYRLNVRFCHEPNGNPAYTAVRRYRSESDELLELLSSEAWCDVVELAQFMPILER